MRWPRRTMLGVLLVPPAWGLAGCSPEHDWREIRPDEGGFMVTLPAKPAKLTRPIHLESLKLDMTMHGAQVREVAYTVGTAVLPSADDAARDRALASMQAAMVRNITGTVRASRPVAITRVDPAGQRIGTAPGVEIEAIGTMRGREALLIARFVGLGAQAWQAVVVGEHVDREHAALFLESLKLVR